MVHLISLRASSTSPRHLFAPLLISLIVSCSSGGEDAPEPPGTEDPMEPAGEGTEQTPQGGEGAPDGTGTEETPPGGESEVLPNLPLAPVEPAPPVTPASTDPLPCSEPFAALEAFDCGEQDIVFENNGPAANRVSYVILGDGYTEDILDTVYREHIQNMLTGTPESMFTQMGEPYLRYRKYINVCALKVASNEACVDDQDTGLQCDTFFNTNGDDNSRLARIGGADRTRVQTVMAEQLPEGVDVDWVGLTVNAGPRNWWNSGGQFMLWNGSYEPRSRSASVALHEGGHAFHGLADEYGGTDCGRNATNPNVTDDPTGNKWQIWLGFDHSAENPDGTGARGTGVQGAFEGALYCNAGYYRPSQESQMNQLPQPFNMPSIDKIVRDIYRIVNPVDDNTDTASPLANPREIRVRLVDPAVVKVDWSVDGAAITNANSQCFDATALGAGEHTVTAHVYDDTPWVRSDRSSLERTLTWTVNVTP